MAEKSDYQVLARRFRPQQFDEVVGQDAAVSTLRGAIRQGRVGHAYLFSGPRGVGKTTIARVLAKALNCAKGPTETPCDACGNCTEITRGNALDVLEIDGASNRGIDEIRNLRENVKYATASCRYKIYIIDEVHMLTQEAFNALLKTLEEPPAHVKFFFATTDPQKMPATILSRCQKFELRRMRSSLMAERLQGLAKREKTSVEKDALLALVVQAQGSMRDAESLLEVLLGAGKKPIDYACVREVLGLADSKVFFDAAAAMFSGDTKTLLTMVSDLYYEGKDPSRFLGGFAGHLRHLILVRVIGKDAETLELPAEQLDELASQAKDISEEHLLAILNLSTDFEQRMRRAPYPRILLELFFMKAAELAQRPPLAGLLGKLESLEAKLKGNGPVSASAEPAAQALPSAPARPAPSPQTTLYDHPDAPEVAQDTDLGRVWSGVAKSLAASHPIIRTCMMDASPIGWKDEFLLVRMKEGATFQRNTLEDKTCQSLIAQKLKARLGKPVRIQLEDKAMRDRPAAKDAPKAPMQKEGAAQEGWQQDPDLQDALSILKGKIVKTIKASPAG